MPAVNEMLLSNAMRIRPFLFPECIKWQKENAFIISMSLDRCTVHFSGSYVAQSADYLM